MRALVALALAGCWVGQAPAELAVPLELERPPRPRHVTCDILPIIVGEIPESPAIDCWSRSWDPSLVDYCLFIRWRDHADELRNWIDRAIGLCSP